MPLRDLSFDAKNPRLPASMQGADQETLAVQLELGFEAYAVAESIAYHGYFNSEPLIVIPSEDGAAPWVVVEGNRRLAALKGLAQAQLRAQFPDPPRWDALAGRTKVTDDTLVPVVVVEGRSVVVPIIGFRHISGILAWTPFAQARYIAKLVDDDRMQIGDVAKLIGLDRTKAGNLYRDQAIAQQAQSLGIDTGPLESSFSLLTVAMSNTQLREHIGAPLGSRLQRGESPIPANRAGQLKEVVTWLFGDGETQPLISDSREISQLARTIANPVGLAAIRAGDTLQTASQRISDAGANPRDRLMKRLATARSALVGAANDLPQYAADQEVRSAVEEARNAIDALQELLDGN